MESPPSDDGFELVEKDSYDDDPAVCTDDEYEFVETPVKRHATLPVGGGKQAFPPPSPETIKGCDQGHDVKTIVQSTPPQGAVNPPRSSPPPPPPQKAPAKEEEKMTYPFSFYDVALPAPPYDLVDMRGVAKLNVAAAPPRCWAPAVHGAYGQDDEVTDGGDDDDYVYQYASCYDYADYGRARRVKRSSGRRGRTKKASTMGRPRGEERSSHIAGNH